MEKYSRRHFMLGAAALTAMPAHGQAALWQDVVAPARALARCHALTIFHEGRPVLQEVFRGPPADQPVPVKSVSKTIVAALLGAALDRGEIPALQATLGQLTPQLIPAEAAPRVAGITMEQLVTMQAGLESTSGPNYGRWVNSADWVAFALSQPIVAEPGSRMIYSTGTSHVLGAVLSEVSGQTLLSLARRRLGLPLGIEIPPWTRDPQGRYLGGNEMALSVNGMARFGEMYRQEGAFGSAQVLSRAWVGRSLQGRTQSPFSGLGYGYGWFLGGASGEAFALARGYGGQVICIVPGLELTVALTSDPTLSARSGGYFGDIMRLIVDDILPVARAQMR